MTEQEEIEFQMLACMGAFEARPDAKSAWCVHHEMLWEGKTESWINRIRYILSYKSMREQAVRFKNFRPCSQHEQVVKLQKDHQVKVDSVCTEYNTKRASLWTDICAKRGSLGSDDSLEKVNSLYADFKTKRAPLLADYQAGMLALYKADVPEGTWNGHSIFS